MKDPKAEVRDSLAWVLGRLCDVLPEPVLEPGTIDQVAQALGAGLSMEPRVASNVCWAIGPLYDAAYEAAANIHGDQAPPSFALSKFTQQFVTGLLATAERADANTDDLQAAAYEALMTVIGRLAEDCYPVVLQCGEQILLRLRTSVSQLAAVTSKEQMRALVQTQSLLCGALVSVVRALKNEDVVRVGPNVMETIFGLFRAKSGAETEVQEDGLMLVGALADSLGAQFEPYLGAVKPFIASGVQNVAASETCKICIGLMGDIATSMGAKIAPHCDEFMTALLQILKMPSLEASIRPIVLAACGDIATGIGGDAFGKYFQFVIAALQESSVSAAKNVSEEDYDIIDEQNDLRNACLSTYTAILLALKGDGATANPNVKHMKPTVPHIIQFIAECLKDTELNESFVRDAAGIIGDAIDIYGAEVKQILPVPFCQELIRRANAGDNEDKQTNRNGRYAQKLMAKIGIQTM